MGEGLLIVQAFAFHQGPLGPLDQGSRVQGDLELVGQGTLELGLGGRPEQAGHHPGIGLQRGHLALVPAPRLGRIHIQGADGATAQLHRNTEPGTDLDLDHGQGDLPQRRSMVASCIIAGRPVVYASMQGPAANTSWLSSRTWARWSDALAQHSRPSRSTSMMPAASASNSCLAATTACCRVAGRSWSGWRSVRVPMLLASIEGSIGVGVCLWVRSPNWRTRSTGQAQMMALGADQAQQPHEIVGARRSRWGSTLQGYPPKVPGNLRVGCLAGGLACRRLPRSLTSLGGLVPPRRRAQTQALSAIVGRPGRPFPP